MKWLILGAGRSGFGAQTLLNHHGIDALIFDENRSKMSADVQAKMIADQEHPLFFADDLHIVLSPGFALDHPLVLRAKSLHQTVISEIDLALRYFSGEIIAITGTNGKSTTTMMIGHLLTQLGYNHAVGGNIGISASGLLAEKKPDQLVLELSSYQIEASHNLHAKIAIMTGITPDHLQRHKTLRNYIAAKWTLFSEQGPNDFAIIEENAFLQARGFDLPIPKSKLILITEHDVHTIQDLLNFRWQHDNLNARLALQAVSALNGRTIQELAPLLHNYRGLPYRCELSGKLGPWSIINDSKGTNVDSTTHALSNVDGKITLFLGGHGKGESFLEFIKYKEKISKIVAFGKSGHQVKEELGSYFPILHFDTLNDAMNNLSKIFASIEGDILFSPACAGFDEFSDFESRGRFFSSRVHDFLKANNVGLDYEPLSDFKKS